MNIKNLIILILLLVASVLFASDHGIYLQTHTKINSNIDLVENTLAEKISSAGFSILSRTNITVPDNVTEDSSEHCGFNAKLIVFKSDKYTQMLASFGNKYLVAGFLRVGIYETPEGVNVAIADPETINRIVFNDLYENDEEEKYNDIVEKTKEFKSNLVKLLHEIDLGEKVEIAMEPIRDDEDLAESSKDMFMMVGPMTLFNDEDQFPVIYTRENSDGNSGLEKLKNEFIENLKSFEPAEDDVEYRWTPSPEDLKWKVISEIYSPDSSAILLGLTRPRTEAVSMYIVSRSRETDNNLCPGIDHAPAYPIEVLLIQEDENINVYTQAEMIRMDMYFWDAGMAAFMDHMSMPGILDESIKKALLGKEYKED